MSRLALDVGDKAGVDGDAPVPEDAIHASRSGHEQLPGGVAHHGARRLLEAHLGVRGDEAALEMAAVHGPGVDVDPQHPLAGLVPQRPLAQLVLASEATVALNTRIANVIVCDPSP